MVAGSKGGPASKGNRARLQGSLDREKLVAYLLAVQILDDIVRQANLLELTEGITLQQATITLKSSQLAAVAATKEQQGAGQLQADHDKPRENSVLRGRVAGIHTCLFMSESSSIGLHA